VLVLVITVADFNFVESTAPAASGIDIPSAPVASSFQKSQVMLSKLERKPASPQNVKNTEATIKARLTQAPVAVESPPSLVVTHRRPARSDHPQQAIK